MLHTRTKERGFSRRCHQRAWQERHAAMGMTAKMIHGVGGGSERSEVTFGKGPINRQLTAIYARDRRR